MKVTLVVGFVVVVTGFVVYALSASMAHGEYDDFDAGISGPLARGAESRIHEPVKVWTRARESATRKEREETFVGMLEAGEEFAVLNHFRRGAELWVMIVKKSDESLKGWVISRAADPIKATKLN